MKLEQLEISCSLLTDKIYLGKPNKKGDTFLEKIDITAKATGAVIQSLGEGTKTLTFGNGAKYRITIEKLTENCQEVELCDNR